MTTANGKGADRLGRFEDLVANALLARQEFLKKFMDPRRNIDDECGYPKSWISADKYQDLYDREAVAARVVQVFPRETWQVQPTVYEDEDADTITPFETAWDELSKLLQGQESWFKQEEGSPVWEYLRRADELSGIGHYGVLLLGLDDGKDLREPVEPGTVRRLLYLRTFPEALAQIIRYEADPASPRFGQPEMYQITFNDPRDQHTGIGLTTATLEVHWTRVIHLADNLGSSEVAGVPRMRPVLNRLLDLQKMYGGSAEMYWRGAFPGLSLETHPQLGGDVEVDHAGLRDQMENYMNGLQRYLALMGISAKSLAPQVVDPTPQISVQIEAICIQLGIPKRVFMGSERGELASTQDDQAWNDRLRQRQRTYVTPRIIVPFVDRLIALGVLPEPAQYFVAWPDLTSQTDSEKADVAVKKTSALAQYVTGGVESVLPPLEYLTQILGMDDEEALAVLTQAAEAAEGERDDTGGSPLLGLVGGVTAVIELYRAAKEGSVSEEQLRQLLITFYKISPETADKLIADGLTPAAEEAGKKPEPPAALPFGGPPGAKPPPFGGAPAKVGEPAVNLAELVQELGDRLETKLVANQRHGKFKKTIRHGQDESGLYSIVTEEESV